MTNHPRYTSTEMERIWSDENRFQKMLKVEIAAAKAMASEGIIPAEAAKDIAEKSIFSLERLQEIETETRHETIAFLTAVKENIGDSGRFLHYGMTSSDVLDTGFSLQLREAADVLIDDLERLLKTLKDRIIEHKMTPCIGRSHGIHAEPTTFGLKLAGHYTAFKRHLERVKMAKAEISVCAISGAIGTFPVLPPSVEKRVAEELGLEIEPVSTQVIPRDRHAMFFSVLAVVASSIENLATEIRHLQRTEVREVEEFFHKGQKGSSAMPHKRNPILSENLTGLSRVIRATVYPALENITLWHERDMSHSSVERFIAPQATATLDDALNRLRKVVENLLVYPEKMQANIDHLKGLVYSQSVLLLLADKGVSREAAYEIVQRNAMKVWGGQGGFKDLLLGDSDLTEYVGASDLSAVFDQKHTLRNVSEVIDRALAD